MMTHIDDRSDKQKAIDTLHLILKRKVEAMLEHGFENWEGEIKASGYTLQGKLDMTEWPAPSTVYKALKEVKHTCGVNGYDPICRACSLLY